VADVQGPANSAATGSVAGGRRKGGGTRELDAACFRFLGAALADSRAHGLASKAYGGCFT